jgi:hypothetical protein
MLVKDWISRSGIAVAILVVASGPSLASPPSYLAATSVPSSYNIGPSGFTVECWVKMRTIAPTPAARNPRVIRCINTGVVNTPSCGSSALNAWELEIAIDGHTSRHAVFGMANSGICSAVVSESVVFDGSFHHLAGTYDGTTLKLYRDGQLDGQQQCPGHQVNVQGGRLRVGNPVNGSPADIDAAFDGVVDEIRIWRVARTASEIAGNMNTELVTPYPADLVAYWKLDGNYGDEVAGNTLIPTGDDSLFAASPSSSLGSAVLISHPGDLVPGSGSAGSYCGSSPPPACSNGIDDDGDGCADMGDLGCASPDDDSEAGAGCSQCANHIDDDGDGCIDLQDPGCTGPADNSEADVACAQCANGIDDDGDGCIDLRDPGCTSATDNSEGDALCTPCSDGIDNDGDGCIDYPRDAGCGSPTDNSEAEAGCAQCANGIDDDGDGCADFPLDPGCSSLDDHSEGDAACKPSCGGPRRRITAERLGDSPLGPGLGLQGFSPNPAVGDPLVEFTLPAPVPALIEVFDVRGRRIAAQRVDGLGIGTHRVRIELGRPLGAGIYTIRLTQGDQRATTRGIVVR